MYGNYINISPPTPWKPPSDSPTPVSLYSTNVSYYKVSCMQNKSIVFLSIFKTFNVNVGH